MKAFSHDQKVVAPLKLGGVIVVGNNIPKLSPPADGVYLARDSFIPGVAAYSGFGRGHWRVGLGSRRAGVSHQMPQGRRW